jgi:hypothetical protein
LFDEFERKAAAVLEDDPAMVKVYWFLARTRALRGDRSGAAETVECALRQFPEDPVTLGNGAGVYASCGYDARAAELRSKLEFLAQIRYVPKAALGFAYTAQGDEEAFYRIMQTAVADREPMVRIFRVMRPFFPVASDPRFDALLDQVRLGDQHVAQDAAIDLAR